MDRRDTRRATSPMARMLPAVGLFLGLAALGTAAGAASVAPASHLATAGHPDVRTAPHPWAVLAPRAAVAPALHTTHYWAGAYYTGANTSATRLATTIKVPDAIPSSSEFYYVLLSVWDNAGSYDQVGFTNDGGVWGWTYSYTSACAGHYYFNPDTINLDRGKTYTFSMNLSTTGSVVFAVATSGKTISTLTAHTGASSFLDQSFYTCGGGTYYDLTDYEESYAVVQPTPSFNYVFAANTQGSAAIKAWSLMTDPPGGGSVQFSGAKVTLVNENFSLSFPSGIDTVKLAAGTTHFTTNVSVADVASSANVTLTFRGTTSVFNVTFSPSSGTPGFVTMVSIGISGAVAHQGYNLFFTGTDSGGAFSFVTLRLTVK